MTTDRCIIQSVDDNMLRYLDLSRPVHKDYAAACHADYEVFVGWKDPHVHPAWNRLPMFLDAFDAGYRKVVWLDADSLVVNQNVDIFAETDDDVPLQMTRVKDAHVELPWGIDGWDVYNDGVLVCNALAREALVWVWSKRHASFLAHHHKTLWELNWLLDWVIAHPSDVELLDLRFNWMDYLEAPPVEEAVIRSWHGMPHEQRFIEFAQTYHEHYP